MSFSFIKSFKLSHMTKIPLFFSRNWRVMLDLSTRHSSSSPSLAILPNSQVYSLWYFIFWLKAIFIKVRKRKDVKRMIRNNNSRWWDLAARSVFKLLTIFSTFLLRSHLFDSDTYSNDREFTNWIVLKVIDCPIKYRVPLYIYISRVSPRSVSLVRANDVINFCR